MLTLDTLRWLASPLRVGNPSPAAAPPEALDWAELLDHADAHSLTPLLCSLWQGAEWWSRVPSEARARAQKALADNRQRQAGVRADLLEIDALLTQAGVHHIALKGYTLAERLYAEAGQRVIYDHDFLVPPEAAQQGHHALLAAGFSRLPEKDEWVEKHLPPLWKNNGYAWSGYLFDPAYPRPVELHVRLWEENWRGLRVSAVPEVRSRASVRSVAGREMLALSDEDLVIHLAMHFAGHLVEREARLNQLLDLARLVDRAHGQLAWGEVAARAGAAGVTRFVYASLWLAHEVFAAPLPPDEMLRDMAHRTPAAFRNWLAGHGAADVLTSNYRSRRRGADYELTFAVAQSLAEKAAVVGYAALPRSGHLLKKYRTQNRWLLPLLYARFVAERLHLYASASRQAG